MLQDLGVVGARDEYSTAAEPSWRNYVRVTEQPWIEHHRFQGTNIYPMAGLIVMAIEGLRQMVDRSSVEGYQFRDMTVHQALVVPSDQSVETRLEIRPWTVSSRSRTAYWKQFTVSSRSEDGTWTTNCSGLAHVNLKPTKPVSKALFHDEKEDINRELQQKYEEVSALPLQESTPEEFYQDISSSGMYLGPTFRGVVGLKIKGTKSTYMMKVQDTSKTMPHSYESPHLIHPATLDVFVHLLISTAANESGMFQARVLVFAESLFVSEEFPSTDSQCYGYCSSVEQGLADMVTDVVAFSKDTNQPLVILEGCRTVPLHGGATKRPKVEAGQTKSLEEWMVGSICSRI